jgi:hypothetical protein
LARRRKAPRYVSYFWSKKFKKSKTKSIPK